MTLTTRIKAAEVPTRKGPAVIVGPHGHCLAPGHTGRVVSTMHGYAIRALKESPNE